MWSLPVISCVGGCMDQLGGGGVGGGGDGAHHL